MISTKISPIAISNSNKFNYRSNDYKSKTMSQQIINQQFNDINNKQENDYQYRFKNPKNLPISKKIRKE